MEDTDQGAGKTGKIGKRDTTVRTGKGRFARTAETAERDAKVCELRTAGLTFTAIAAQVDCSVEEARRGYERALKAVVQEPAEQARALELERLDALWRQAWEVMERSHVLVSGGKVVMTGDAESGREAPLEDDGPSLQAIDRLLKIATRRAALLGLDAPTKIVTDGQVKYVIEGVDLGALK